MREYVLVTDDSCDLPPEYCKQNGIYVLYLSFIIDGVRYTAENMPSKSFYNQLREGKMPTTTQISVDEWAVLFERLLTEGKDILYLAFTSGLSGTCGSAQVAARELRERFPERKLVVIDTMCASLGQGLIVHKANMMYRSGASLEEVAKWVEENCMSVIHMVVVEDLMHLHRGGRVSKTSAVAGSLLGIKPIIHLTDEGKLVPIEKVRGRKQSLQKGVELLAERIGDAKPDYFTISHSDCEEDAIYAAELISKRLGIKDHMIHFIGPVIGSHTGTGTVAMFAMGKYR